MPRTDCAIQLVRHHVRDNIQHNGGTPTQRDRIEYPVQAYWGKVASLATLIPVVAIAPIYIYTYMYTYIAQEAYTRSLSSPGVFQSLRKLGRVDRLAISDKRKEQANPSTQILSSTVYIKHPPAS